MASTTAVVFTFLGSPRRKGVQTKRLHCPARTFAFLDLNPDMIFFPLGTFCISLKFALNVKHAFVTFPMDFS